MLPWSCLAVNTTHPVRATSRPELANVCVAPPGPGGAVSHEQAPLVAADHVRVVVLVHKVATVVPVQFDPAGLQGGHLFVAVFRHKDLHCSLSCRTVSHSFHRDFFVQSSETRCLLALGLGEENYLLYREPT